MHKLYDRGVRIVRRCIDWLARWLGPWTVMTVVLAVGLAVIAVLVKLTGEVYEEVAFEGGTAHIDEPVLNFMIGLRTSWLSTLVNFYTHVGGKVGGTIGSLLLIVVLSLLMRSWRPAVLIVPVSLGSVLMSVVGKELVGRQRPPHAHAIPPYEVSPSFPSGHTVFATAIMVVTAYLLFIWLKDMRAKVVALIICGAYALTMGLSRVYLGHHWLTDVIAGYGIGAAWGIVIVLSHQVFETVRSVRRERAQISTRA